MREEEETEGVNECTTWCRRTQLEPWLALADPPSTGSMACQRIDSRSTENGSGDSRRAFRINPTEPNGVN